MKSPTTRDIIIGVVSSLIASLIVYIISTTSVSVTSDPQPTSAATAATTNTPIPQNEIKIHIPFYLGGVSERLEIVYTKMYFFFYDVKPRSFWNNLVRYFLNIFLLAVGYSITSFGFAVLYELLTKKALDIDETKYKLYALAYLVPFIDYFFTQGKITYFSLYALVISLIVMLSHFEIENWEKYNKKDIHLIIKIPLYILATLIGFLLSILAVYLLSYL